MQSETLYKMLRYLVQGVTIFLLFKYVPKQPMDDKDILMITAVIVLAYAVYDNAAALLIKQEPMTNLTPAQCAASCSVKEHMESVPSVQPPQMTPPQSQSQPENVNANPRIERKDRIRPEDVKAQEMERDKQNAEPTYQTYNMVPTINENNRTGSRAEEGVMTNEMMYTDFNTIPVTIDSNVAFEYGDSFLPPSQWYPMPPHPPVCVSEKRCQVCPVTTIGTPVDVKEWHQSRRITPADNINVDYIKEKLNSGR